MRLNISSPAVARTYALEMLREEMQQRPVRPSRAERRAQRRAAREAERPTVSLSPSLSRRVARSLRLAH
jgi:hypothetical protein